MMRGFEIVIFPFIALLWIVGCYRVMDYVGKSARCHTHQRSFLFVTFASTVFSLLWHWRYLQVFTESGFYPGDSIYTLGLFKAIALACLTTVLLLCTAYSSWRITNIILQRIKVTTPVAAMAALLNGLLAMILYWILLSVVPQLYYMIYLQIFPNLPAQLVVKNLLSSESFFAVLFFLERASLSNHAAGLLGWVLFVNAVTQWRSATRTT